MTTRFFLNGKAAVAATLDGFELSRLDLEQRELVLAPQDVLERRGARLDHVQ